MNAKRTLTLLLFSLLMKGQFVFAQSAEQEDYLQLIAEYVNKIENIYNGNWAYTYTIDDKLEQESWTIRRNDSLSFMDSQQLLAVNGMPASEERLQEHRERRERALRRRQNDDDEDEDEEEGEEKQRFLEMLVADSIEFIRQEDELLYLGFRAMEEERQKIFEYLQGVLIIDTEAEYIKELQVTPTEPFSPFFLGSVEDGYFSVRFELHEGVPMQSALTWQVDGRAYFIRRLEADREIVWTDLERINEEETEASEVTEDSSPN